MNATVKTNTNNRGTEALNNLLLAIRTAAESGKMAKAKMTRAEACAKARAAKAAKRAKALEEETTETTTEVVTEETTETTEAVTEVTETTTEAANTELDINQIVAIAYTLDKIGKHISIKFVHIYDFAEKAVTFDNVLTINWKDKTAKTHIETYAITEVFKDIVKKQGDIDFTEFSTKLYDR